MSRQPFDASTDVGVLLHALDAGTGRLGRFADRLFRSAAPAPADYARLRSGYRRLAAVRAAVESVLPESPRARAARRRREAARERLLDSPVQYRLKRGGGADRPEPDWASSREVGELLEGLPAALVAAEAAAAAWEARLVAALGAEVGGRLYASLRDWCRRKREAWAACGALLARQRQLAQEAERLRGGGGAAAGADAEGREGLVRDAENSAAQAAAHEERILEGIDAMNRCSCGPRLG